MLLKICVNFGRNNFTLLSLSHSLSLFCTNTHSVTNTFTHIPAIPMLGKGQAHTHTKVAYSISLIHPYTHTHTHTHTHAHTYHTQLYAHPHTLTHSQAKDTCSKAKRHLDSRTTGLTICPNCLLSPAAANHSAKFRRQAQLTNLHPLIISHSTSGQFEIYSTYLCENLAGEFMKLA